MKETVAEKNRSQLLIFFEVIYAYADVSSKHTNWIWTNYFFSFWDNQNRASIRAHTPTHTHVWMENILGLSLYFALSVFKSSIRGHKTPNGRAEPTNKLAGLQAFLFEIITQVLSSWPLMNRWRETSKPTKQPALWQQPTARKTLHVLVHIFLRAAPLPYWKKAFLRPSDPETCMFVEGISNARICLWQLILNVQVETKPSFDSEGACRI